MERVYNAFLEIVWSYNRIDPIRSREDNIFLIVWSNFVSKFRTMRSINANVVSVLSSVKTVGLLPLLLRSFIKSEQSVGTVVGCAMRFMHEQRGFLRVTAETVADVAIIKRTRPWYNRNCFKPIKTNFRIRQHHKSSDRKNLRYPTRYLTRVRWGADTINPWRNLA